MNAEVTLTDKGIAHIVQWVKGNAPLCFNRVWLEEVTSTLKWSLESYHNGYSPLKRRHYEFPSFCTKSGKTEWLELSHGEEHYTVTFAEG